MEKHRREENMLLTGISLDTTSASLEPSLLSTLHLRHASATPTLLVTPVASAAIVAVFLRYSSMLFAQACIGSRVFHVSLVERDKKYQMSYGQHGRCVDRIRRCGRPEMPFPYIISTCSIGQSNQSTCNSGSGIPVQTAGSVRLALPNE